MENRVATAFFPYEPNPLGRLIHPDHLGTPQKLTDSTGAVVWSADYKPFGETTVTVSTIINNLRFPGQYYDQETGLNYNYFRDYNPAIGKYVESDPLYFGIVRMTASGLKIGFPLLKPRKQKDISLYLYVGDNPINLVDPLGLYASCPLNTYCPGAPKYNWGPLSPAQCICWCKQLNKTPEDQCKCMSEPFGDDDLYDACMKCNSKGLSEKEACVCACKLGAEKSAEKGCEKLCDKICK